MEAHPSTLEEALARSESDIDAASKAASATLTQLKMARKAAASGTLRDLEKRLATAEQLAGALRDSVRAARAGWNFDDREYLASGAYAQEVLRLGQSRGLTLQEQDDRLVSYPSLVRVLPQDAAIEIDRKKVRTIRPSAVVEQLAATQSRPVRFNAERFIESLFRAYSHLRASTEKQFGGTVKLVDVYAILTLLPGQAALYSQQEFARDIYLLDESGLDRTKDGARMSLPASSGARTSSTLATVMRNGELKIYYGIEFPVTLSATEYVAFLESEYLSDFIKSGGSAVKFAVADDGDILRSRLRSAALAEGYAVASVDAREVRVHMIDKVFHDVARQVDWDAGAIVFARRAFQSLGFTVPENTSDLTLERIAALNNFDQNELRLDFQRKLQADILRDFEMSQEFRRAMIRLCQGQVDRSDHAQADRDAILAWLRGELRLITALRQAGIFQKVARHNARDLLFSLSRWLVKTGHSGLVLDFDIRRCAVSGRPAESDGVFYTKAACLDAYELLRQLIDATDELSSCFVLVTTAAETLTDPRRGIEHVYPALKMRIWNEVRDRRRANPFAALIRLDSSEVAS